jgi:hypothetical protein
MKTILLKMGFAFMLGLLLTTSSANSADEDSAIKIRLYYKIILNPRNLARPNPTTRAGEAVTNAMIEEAGEKSHRYVRRRRAI